MYVIPILAHTLFASGVLFKTECDKCQPCPVYLEDGAGARRTRGNGPDCPVIGRRMERTNILETSKLMTVGRVIRTELPGLYKEPSSGQLMAS